jgi:hypothetical protein
MTFLNRKEEVLDIQLTQYGKHLLSLGKFKPAYYEFFDDDIIYDNQYAGSEDELQRDIQTRIKEAPRPHVQYNFVSAQDEIRKQIEQVRNKSKGSFSDVYIPYSVKHRALSAPLGNSELGEQKKASWNVRAINGSFSDTKTFITGTFSNLKIPRLTIQDTEYKIRVARETGNINTTENMTLEPISDLNSLSTRFSDNTYLQVQDSYILLDLQEMNVDFEQENFDVELYCIDEDENGEEILSQLYFAKTKEQVVDNLLIEDESEFASFDMNDKTIVQNLFNIRADREIDSSVMCRDLTQEEKQILVATNQLDLECEERFEMLTNPRIISDVKQEDIGDKC